MLSLSRAEGPLPQHSPIHGVLHLEVGLVPDYVVNVEDSTLGPVGGRREASKTHRLELLVRWFKGYFIVYLIQNFHRLRHKCFTK